MVGVWGGRQYLKSHTRKLRKNSKLKVRLDLTTLRLYSKELNRSLRKRSTFHDATNGFATKWSKFWTNQKHYPDQDSARHLKRHSSVVRCVWDLLKIDHPPAYIIIWKKKTLKARKPRDLSCLVQILGSLSNDDGDGNENGKKEIGLDWLNNKLCTCITLFCTFLSRRCTTTTGKSLIVQFRVRYDR